MSEPRETPEVDDEPDWDNLGPPDSVRVVPPEVSVSIDIAAGVVRPFEQPDDAILPCDLRVGNGTFRKGVKVSTAQGCIDRHLGPYRGEMLAEICRLERERDEAREMLRTVLHEAGERGISDDTWDRAQKLLEGM